MKEPWKPEELLAFSSTGVLKWREVEPSKEFYGLRTIRLNTEGFTYVLMPRRKDIFLYVYDEQDTFVSKFCDTQPKHGSYVIRLYQLLQ